MLHIFPLDAARARWQANISLEHKYTQKNEFIASHPIFMSMFKLHFTLNSIRYLFSHPVLYPLLSQALAPIPALKGQEAVNGSNIMATKWCFISTQCRFKKLSRHKTAQLLYRDVKCSISFTLMEYLMIKDDICLQWKWSWWQLPLNTGRQSDPPLQD